MGTRLGRLLLALIGPINRSTWLSPRDLGRMCESIPSSVPSLAGQACKTSVYFHTYGSLVEPSVLRTISNHQQYHPKSDNIFVEMETFPVKCDGLSPRISKKLSARSDNLAFDGREKSTEAPALVSRDLRVVRIKVT